MQPSASTPLQVPTSNLQPLMKEADVTITDYLLALEAFAFAVLIARSATGTALQRWFVIFFAATAAASLVGGTVHGFFNDSSRALAARPHLARRRLGGGVGDRRALAVFRSHRAAGHGCGVGRVRSLLVDGRVRDR